MSKQVRWSVDTLFAQYLVEGDGSDPDTKLIATFENSKDAETTSKLHNALMVFVTDTETVKALEQIDPQALKQAREALGIS